MSTMDNYISRDESAFYSIQLQGELDQDWADNFGKLKVTVFHADDSRRSPVTTIVGEVVDQAALAGFLSLVYDLGLPLLSVTCLGKA